MMYIRTDYTFEDIVKLVIAAITYWRNGQNIPLITTLKRLGQFIWLRYVDHVRELRQLEKIK